MKKILLLTTTVLLFAVNANAACNPNLPACQCSYPKMVNGIIGCSETYCETGTKCMPDGSCCSSDNYCESTEKEKQCCSAEQSCDTTKGCIELDIETKCANAEGGGIIVTASSGTFCMSNSQMNWHDAKEWCLDNGMIMPTMYEICPSWTGDKTDGKHCPELEGATSVAGFTATTFDTSYASPYQAMFVDGMGRAGLTFCSDGLRATCRQLVKHYEYSQFF